MSLAFTKVFLMNSVLIAVAVMLILALCRVHVVLSLFIGALVGGLLGGLDRKSVV